MDLTRLAHGFGVWSNPTFRSGLVAGAVGDVQRQNGGTECEFVAFTPMTAVGQKKAFYRDSWYRLPMLSLGHQTVLAPTLSKDVVHGQESLGRKVPFGTRHGCMGAHDHPLQPRDGVFLEVVAIDAKGVIPNRAGCLQAASRNAARSSALRPKAAIRPTSSESPEEDRPFHILRCVYGRFCDRSSFAEAANRVVSL